MKYFFLTLFLLGILIGMLLMPRSASPKAPEASTTATSTEVNCIDLGNHKFYCGDPETYPAHMKALQEKLNSKPVTQVKKATVSFYTSEVRQTDDSPEIAANGQNIWELYKKGQKTCASNDYKIGTKLEIDGVGTCIVRDRMNTRYTGTGRIDWYLGYSHADAWKSGIKKNVSVIIASN